MHERKKYSLWLCPRDEQLQLTTNLVNQLALRYSAPKFVPHLTLVAKILADDQELEKVNQDISSLAKQISPLFITLEGYGFKDERYRCLYLLARSSELANLYDLTANYFPQVKSEHFQALPHMSVLYGDFAESTKREIISEHPIEPLDIKIDYIDLCLTEGQASEWQIIHSQKL